MRDSIIQMLAIRAVLSFAFVYLGSELSKKFLSKQVLFWFVYFGFRMSSCGVGQKLDLRQTLYRNAGIVHARNPPRRNRIEIKT